MSDQAQDISMAVGGSAPDPWTQAVTLQTYSLELIGPQVWGYREAVDLMTSWQKFLREVEENLTDLLPPGFSVVIREWDEEEK